MKRPTPDQLLVAAWIAVPLLGVLLYVAAGNLEESWRARPPTEVEQTDCRIEAMMEGDNPVEVEVIQRECLQAVNDAYVAPRRLRTRLLFGVVFLGFAGAVVGVTRTRRARSP